MTSNQQQSLIIQNSLLKWVSLLTQTKLSSFDQLIRGQFYIQLLSHVKQFKFTKPLKQLNQQPENTISLANRVGNIKIIGQSVIRYYQVKLMKDISMMKINYVELCMGNIEQSIKLFSLVIGIFVNGKDKWFRLDKDRQSDCKGQLNDFHQGQKNGNKNNFLGPKNLFRDKKQTIKFYSQLDNRRQGTILDKIYDSINKLQPDDQYIVKALLQNTKTIGQQIEISQNSPLRQQLLSKLQAYQEKIQNLEMQNEQYRILIQQDKTSRQYLEQEIKEFKTEKNKLIQKIQLLQVLNNRLENENTQYLMQNDNNKKKLELQKRQYEQLINKGNMKIVNYEKQMKNMEYLKRQTQQLKNINKELKEQLQNNINQSLREKQRYEMIKQENKKLQNNYNQLLKKYNQIDIQYQELKFKYQTNSNIKGKNNMYSPYHYYVSNNSQLSSLKYRLKDKFQAQMKGDLSQFQMFQSNMVRKISKQTNSNIQSKQNKMIKGLSNKINSQLINQQPMNQSRFNISNYIIEQIGNRNIKDIQDVSEFNGQQLYTDKNKNKQITNQKKFLYNEQQLDKSIVMDDKQIQRQRIQLKTRDKQIQIKQRQNKFVNNQGKKQITQRNSPINIKTYIKNQHQSINTQGIQEQNKLLIQFISQIYQQNQQTKILLNEYMIQLNSYKIQLTKQKEQSTKYKKQTNKYKEQSYKYKEQSKKYKEQLIKYSQDRKSKINRIQKFKQKLKQIKQFEPIQSINQFIQNNKQNIPINIIDWSHKSNNNGKQNESSNINKNSKQQNKSIKQPKSINHQYPFYQMTLN